eukprot:4044457-Pyramimonas_sp.AAC.1
MGKQGAEITTLTLRVGRLKRNAQKVIAALEANRIATPPPRGRGRAQPAKPADAAGDLKGPSDSSESEGPESES